MDSTHFTRRTNRLGAEHPRRVAWLRVAIGIWLLCLMSFFVIRGEGEPWVWLFAVGTLVHFVWAYRLFRNARLGEAMAPTPGG